MRSRAVLMMMLAALVSARARAAGPGAHAPWEGTGAGVTNEVLPPWTPIVATGDRVEIWGRTLRLGALALPASLQVRGVELLTGPIHLAGEVAGKTLTWINVVPRQAEARPDRVRLVSTSRSADFQCEAETIVEYDGMVRCNLRLIPLQGKTRIDRLALEIPLAAAHAIFLHTWPGSWGSRGQLRRASGRGVAQRFQAFRLAGRP